MAIDQEFWGFTREFLILKSTTLVIQFHTLPLDLIKYNWVGKFCHALEMIRKMGPLFRPYTCVCGNGSIHIEIKTEIIRIQFKLIASQFLVILIQRVTAVTFCGRLFFRTSFSFSTSLYVFLFSSDLGYPSAFPSFA